MNELRKTGFRFFRYNSCHDCVAPASPWVDRQLFSLPRGPRPRKLGSPPATARFARATASHSIDCSAQAVLACVENVLVRVEEASRLGYSPNRCELASSRVSFVLDMDRKIQTSRRAEACQQRGSRPDLSNGCRESDLGSAATTQNRIGLHGELLKLGFDLSERSVSRWIRRAPRNTDPVKQWLTFLRNHRESIAAMDFFTVPTLTFGVLYCFFIIG